MFRSTRTNSIRVVVLVVIIAIVVILGYRTYHAHQLALQNVPAIETPIDIHSDYQPLNVASNANATDTADIEDLVVAFGSKLQMVPLSASKDITAQAITDNYSAYVSTDLLTTWEANPTKAPGRRTSSPWPDHIEISSITKNIPKNSNDSGGINEFTVAGHVIELTSNEVAHGGIADSYPIILTVQDQSGVWIITAVSI